MILAWLEQATQGLEIRTKLASCREKTDFLYRWSEAISWTTTVYFLMARCISFTDEGCLSLVTLK